MVESHATPFPANTVAKMHDTGQRIVSQGVFGEYNFVFYKPPFQDPVGASVAVSTHTTPQGGKVAPTQRGKITPPGRGKVPPPQRGKVPPARLSDKLTHPANVILLEEASIFLGNTHYFSMNMHEKKTYDTVIRELMSKTTMTRRQITSWLCTKRTQEKHEKTSSDSSSDCEWTPGGRAQKR